MDNDTLNGALHESILVACREEGRRQEAAQCTPSSNVLRSMSCFLFNIACPVEDAVVSFPALVQGKSSSFVRRFCIEDIRCARPRPSVVDVSPYWNSGDFYNAKVCKEAR